MTVQDHCTTCAPTLPRQRRSVIRLISMAFAAARQRRQLRNLAPHRLQDLGLTQADVARESDKTIWNVPQHWLD